MASIIRPARSTRLIKTLLQSEQPSLRQRRLRPSYQPRQQDARQIRPFFPYQQRAGLHTGQALRKNEEAPTTDFGQMDVLGNTPAPSTSIDVCMSDGFSLNSGSKIMDGSGMILVGGDAFSWRPWTANKNGEKKLLNAKGQWEVPDETLGLFGLIWPRPDLLILGLGPEMRPLSPATRRHISSLGIRVEILDTRNAASQFNLLATERGVDEVAAALIPIGWKEGVGAV